MGKTRGESPRKRAAAYCRVSTDMECQEKSFETQKQYYREMLSDKPDEELVRLYADAGSGRNVQGRPSFQQMIFKLKSLLSERQL